MNAPSERVARPLSEVDNGLTFDMASDQHNALRRLRLWHWRKAMEIRRLLERQQPNLSAEVIKGRTSTIYLHIGFVQSLNEFFEIGDTAERDAIS